MIKIIISVIFLAMAVAACLYINDGSHPCAINAPMEQSQCRAVGVPLAARKVFHEQND